MDERLMECWARMLQFLCFGGSSSGRILSILKRLLPQIIAIKDVMETLATSERAVAMVLDPPHGAAETKNPRVLSRPEPIHSPLILTRLLRAISLLPMSISSGFHVTNAYTVLFTLLTLFRSDKLSGSSHLSNDMKRWVCLTIHRLFHPVATHASNFEDSATSGRNVEAVNYRSWFTLTSACYSSILVWINSASATKKSKNWSVCSLALIDILCLSSPEFFLKEMETVVEGMLYRVYNCVETSEAVEEYASLDQALITMDGDASSKAITDGSNQLVTLATLSPLTGASSHATSPHHGSHLHTIIFLSLSHFLSLYLRKVSVRHESVSSNLDRISELYVQKNKDLFYARLGGREVEQWMEMSGAFAQASSGTNHPDGANQEGGVMFVDQQLLLELSNASTSPLTQGVPFTKPKSHIFTRSTQHSLQILLLTMALANHATHDTIENGGGSRDKAARALQERFAGRESKKENMHRAIGSVVAEEEDEKEEKEIDPEELPRARAQKRLSMAPALNFASPAVLKQSQAQLLSSGFHFVLHEVLLPMFAKQQRNWTTMMTRRAAATAGTAVVPLNTSTDPCNPSSPARASSTRSLTSPQRSPSTRAISSPRSPSSPAASSSKAPVIDTPTMFGTEKTGLAVPVLVALKTFKVMCGLKSEGEKAVEEIDASVALHPASSAPLPVSAILSQLSSHFPLLSPRGTLRCHSALSHSFYTPFSRVLSGCLVEMRRVGGKGKPVRRAGHR